jgi:hypothetical protein
LQQPVHDVVLMSQWLLMTNSYACYFTKLNKSKPAAETVAAAAVTAVQVLEPASEVLDSQSM